MQNAEFVEDLSCSIGMEEKRAPSESAKSLLNLAAAAEAEEEESECHAAGEEMDKLDPGVVGRGWFDRKDASMSPKINVNSLSGERSITTGHIQLLRADAGVKRKESAGATSNKSNKSTPKGKRKRREKEEEKTVGCPKARSFKNPEQRKVEENPRTMFIASKSAEVEEAAEVDMERYLFRMLRAPYERRRSRGGSRSSLKKDE